MADIFLSYSSSEKERIIPLVQILKQQGWSVWWDRKIPPGKKFDDVIEEALNAAKCVVVIWSAKSVESDWIKSEAEEGSKRGILVPILIDDVTIPFEFRRIQAARITDLTKLSSDAEFKDFLNAVAALIGKPPRKEFIKQDTVLSLEEERVFPKERIKEKIETKKHVKPLKYDSKYLKPAIITSISLVIWIYISTYAWGIEFWYKNLFVFIPVVTLAICFFRPIKFWLASLVVFIIHVINLIAYDTAYRSHYYSDWREEVWYLIWLIVLLNAGIAALICRLRLKSPRFKQIPR